MSSVLRSKEATPLACEGIKRTAQTDGISAPCFTGGRGGILQICAFHRVSWACDSFGSLAWIREGIKGSALFTSKRHIGGFGLMRVERR